MNSGFTLLDPIRRIRLWYALLLFLCSVFVIRLFYLQVIRHNHYVAQARSSQFKEYEIPASRGVIEAHLGGEVVPIVLNQKLYTLYADPVYVEDADKAAEELSRITGANPNDYEDQLKTDGTRYVILAKKLNREQSDKIMDLDLKGIGTREVPYRTYPQGSLASQLLGFVNDEGQGTYGLEQALHDDLKGKPGQLKAITDASGVPLAANQDNVNINPEEGKRVTLTIDIAMQQQVEQLLQAGLKRSMAESGSAVVLEAKTGAIKAMANYPTYDPSKFTEVEDANLFKNKAITDPLEIGSIMKPLTAAAALDLGVIHRSQTYYDPAQFKIDEATVRNIEEDGGPGTRSIQDILQLSLNTGATWLLMQMGGGEINSQARERWYDYMTNHYRFGKLTGIEQGGEAPGVVPKPNDGFGLNIRYANTSFGQGMTATPLQMAAAIAGVVNGGTYNRPHLVEKMTDSSGNEKRPDNLVLNNDVVSDQAGRDLREMMEYTIQKNRLIYQINRELPEYRIGGKTGTAEVVDPATGRYYENLFNGMFMGFVGGDEVQYVVVVRADKPRIGGYAGTTAAAPLFRDIVYALVDNFGVTPKTK